MTIDMFWQLQSGSFLIHDLSHVIRRVVRVGGVGTADPSGTPEFIPVVSAVRAVRSLVFCVVLCRSLFVLFLFVIALSVLRFKSSYYPFSISNICPRYCTAQIYFVLSLILRVSE